MPAIALFLKAALGSVFGWLSKLSFAQIVLIGLALFAGLQTIRVSAEKRHSAKVETQLRKCTEARQADRRSYERAQKDAAAKNHAQVEQIRSKQEAITDDVKSTLSARLELIRRELRKPAPQGAPRGPGAGEAGQAPCRAYDPTWLCVAPAERLRAAENEERHDQLITWAERQSQVQ